MSKDLQGFYVDANKLGDWLSRLDDLTEQVRELASEVRAADCVEINVRRADAKERADLQGSKRKRAKPAPAQADVQAAAADLEQATKAAPKGHLNGHAEAPAASEPRAEEPAAERVIKPRIRFGRLREQLMVDHGQDVTQRMVEMCGSERTTFRLKKHLERFLGTFDDDIAAKMAYGTAIGLQHADEMGVDDVLGEVTDMLTHEDGRISLWCNEDEVDKVRAQRGLANAEQEEVHAQDPAGAQSEQPAF